MKEVFDWSNSASILKDFGGKSVTLHVPKTGLPFFDALRIYGAIDLYIGLREEVNIHDAGNEWQITGYQRPHLIDKKDEEVFKQVYAKKTPKPAEFCKGLRSYLFEIRPFTDLVFVEAEGEFVGLDAVLQAGIRGISAYSYETLQTGQTSKSECKAKIPLSQALLAVAGKKRTEGLGNIMFLPIFEGRIDLSKVVSPIHAWIGSPNVVCSQALALLMLKTSLFSEGYQDRLSAVVFNTNLGSQRSDNYSGLITIESTAIGKIESSAFVSHIYTVLRTLIGKAWVRKKSTEFTLDAFAMAYWVLQPTKKHLSSLITSQEKMKARGYPQIFREQTYVKEVFGMSYGKWDGDHKAVQKFARAIASAIDWARGRDNNGKELPDNEQRKNWYDEVTMLRSSPTAKAFIERSLILLEQGHREHGQIGTLHRDEDYDPSSLFASIGKDRNEFETFRDLFRMYLIQESTDKAKDSTDDSPDADSSIDTVSETKEEE